MYPLKPVSGTITFIWLKPELEKKTIFVFDQKLSFATLRRNDKTI